MEKVTDIIESIANEKGLEPADVRSASKRRLSKPPKSSSARSNLRTIVTSIRKAKK